jgi:hypothetical protein
VKGNRNGKIKRNDFPTGKGDINFSASIVETGQGWQRPYGDQSSKFGACKISTFDGLSPIGLICTAKIVKQEK